MLKTLWKKPTIATLLALLWVAVAPIQGATASDPFSGSGTLTTGWTNVRAGLDQQAGNLRSTSSFGIALRSDITPGADQYSAAVVGVSASNIFNGRSYLFVRLQDVDNYYEAELEDLRHSATIYRRIGGVDGSPIYTVSMPASVVAGDTIRMNISSAHVITLYRNGTSFGSFDDAAGASTLTTGGVGLGLSGTASDSGVWAYWEGGDASGGGCTDPAITVQPSNASVYEPATGNFTVTATGTSLTYQWKRGGVNVSTGSGGTTNSYTTAATTVAGDNGASFTVVVSGACGSPVTSSAATLTVSTAPTSGLPYSQNFDAATTSDSTCWAARPNGDENSAGCLDVTNVGKGTASQPINRIGRYGISHSGLWANRIEFDSNEHEARASVNNINSDSMHLRAWMYFDGNYDHAFGEKIFRFVSTDSVGVGGCASGSLYWDLIFYIRSATQTSGRDDMGSITGEANGGSGGLGGGSFITANIAFPRGVWFEVQVKIHLNTAGASDGSASIWYNDSLIANQTGINNMRTSSRGCGYSAATDTHKITSFKWVGWYSNGGCSGCAEPSSPAIKYIDDVCAQTTKCSSLVGGGGSPPVVTVDPSNATVLAPATTTFSVTATGATSYQWQKGTTNVSSGTGGTTANYTIPASVLADNGSTYRCIVTNADGADTSAAATLTVNQIPIITADPSNATVTAPATNAFTSTTTGTATITYQWQKNGSNISGATASGYTTPATTYADNGAVYRVIATNAYGADTSAGATLTVHSAPVITTNPISRTAYVGQTSTFTVIAAGDATLTYQWKLGGVNVSTGTGGTTASYTTGTLGLGDTGGSYTVVVTNSYGSATSTAAILTVTTASAIAPKCQSRFWIGLGLGL